MSQKTFKSPGVSTREIDLSQPTNQQPSGVPAGVIGTARRGPAFVPRTVATFQDFVANFGNSDGESFGPLAMNEWLRNANAGTYVRLLGIGDGKARVEGGSNAGKVQNAGFVVGDQLVDDNGFVNDNPFAEGSNKGRTYFLGSLVKDANNSGYLASAGIAQNNDPNARPILRGVLLAASGVYVTLKSELATENEPNASVPGGEAFGDVLSDGSKREIVVLLNGLQVNDEFTNVITASLDPKAPNSISNSFNTDPTKFQKAGHLLYAYYDVPLELTEITGSGVTSHEDPIDKKLQTAFCLHGSSDWNSGSVGNQDNIGLPNFEGFEDRFQAAFSPWVTSQDAGSGGANLFKFHALDDGRAGSETFKITIENIAGSSNENNVYGTFDVLVRKFDDSDRNPVVLESFRGLTLNPSDERFILRAIGDTHVFYDFDKQTANQKLVIDGMFDNRSQYIRVEPSDSLLEGSLDPSLLPVGFRGMHHLVTNGTDIEGNHVLTGEFDDENLNRALALSVLQPPVPMRMNISSGVAPSAKPITSLTWGVQLETQDSIAEPNRNLILNESFRSFVKYFPSYHTNFPSPWVGDNSGTLNVGNTVLDADKFNHNAFSMEKIAVITGSNGFPDPEQWSAARYIRNGVLPETLVDRDGNVTDKVRFINGNDLTNLPTRPFLKFTLPLQGGFDGTNIFDKQKSMFSNVAVVREFEDSAKQGGADGPTIAAFRKAIRVMEEKSDVDIQLLAIPGIRHQSVTNFAIDSVERRFDALYIMDIEQRDGFGDNVISNSQNVSVSLTSQAHASKNFNTSFAAAYFPDVVLTDPAMRTEVQCPPSVAVLGAMSFNDRVSHPWFAPAGFRRGALNTVSQTAVKLNKTNMDDLYEVDINPITAFPNTGVVIYGQKTLLASQSALDRVNVRRLLIEIRRQVRNVANGLIFEPNRESTLENFQTQVTPILNRIQARQGVERFNVQIDASTTTQADVENNTIRGKIYVQPTRSIEFVSIDFVVTNSGNLI
jgi:phage tail sheath protein FI